MATNKSSVRDWRHKTMARVRALIKQADPKVVEERKWRMPSKPAGVPTWYHDGIILIGETFKEHMRLTFVKGSELRKKHKKLFNAYRSIVLREGDKLNEREFKSVFREAVVLNQKKKASR